MKKSNSVLPLLGLLVCPDDLDGFYTGGFPEVGWNQPGETLW